MELLCIEVENEPKGYLDPVFLDDERVLGNLLQTEEKYIISSHYFNCFQSELQPYMRKIVCSWMLEVCEEEKCQDEVFTLAMNIMDRYLSQVVIRKKELQLLGTVSLFLASKLRQTVSLDADRLVSYTDNSITSEDLLTWEMLVLTQLRWDLSAITPNDFVNPLVRRLGSTDFVKKNEAALKKHIQTFISFCAAEIDFMSEKPSTIATACVGFSLQALLRTMSFSPKCLDRILSGVRDRLLEITGIPSEDLQRCFFKLSCIVDQENSTPSIPHSTVHISNPCKQHHNVKSVTSKQEGYSSQPETPTDVQDVII